MQKQSDLSTQQQDPRSIIELIQQHRNDLIKDFLDERNLVAYVAQQYKLVELSPVKIQFIRRDLKVMLAEPVDGELYREIIEDFNASGTVSFTGDHGKLFYRELDRMIKKYIYAS
ncbi:hypothetical protein [Ohtaekwangia koreensis]|uniref:Uncharacterized protein n=1 Tax=Ohtaekwangia koreensis TaxID=688867 RepID=A0A1T5M828_9BACT|nr:hypothetical protein [Ohtaekwangia koreensis]SKC84164.1 hypothetical protein SAMN05660236_4691 [Ohtaekwangia koreensis]